MVKHFRCFKSATNVGLLYSRVDVLGVRDIGGSLSGDIETIVIEVKRGTEPFATASGQALGYQVYANRVYLADHRADGFAHSELEIASHLGIGLVQIRGNACREILSSPHHRPIVRMSLELVEKLALGKCLLCGTFFEIGAGRGNQFSRLTRNRIDRAITREGGSCSGIKSWPTESESMESEPHSPAGPMNDDTSAPSASVRSSSLSCGSRDANSRSSQIVSHC